MADKMDAVTALPDFDAMARAVTWDLQIPYPPGSPKHWGEIWKAARDQLAKAYAAGAAKRLTPIAPVQEGLRERWLKLADEATKPWFHNPGTVRHGLVIDTILSDLAAQGLRVVPAPVEARCPKCGLKGVVALPTTEPGSE